MTRLFPPIFFLIFSAAVSLAGAANLLDGSAASERRMELLKLKFEKALKKARCPYGVLCVATVVGLRYASVKLGLKTKQEADFAPAVLRGIRKLRGKDGDGVAPDDAEHEDPDRGDPPGESGTARRFVSKR